MAAKTYNSFGKSDTRSSKKVTSFLMDFQVITTASITTSAARVLNFLIPNLSVSSISLVKFLFKPTLTNEKMKAKSFLLLAFTCFSSFIFSAHVNAQTTTVTGPSDNTTAPPTSASAVAQVLGTGSAISLKVGSTTTATDIRYQWYKLDNTGTKRLVQDGSDNTLRETAAGAGYYTYQLVMSNSNQCTSDISDPFNVYVLPALNPTIAASSGTICSNGTSTSTLTANPGNTNYSYLYQWSMNGTDIQGATAATYTTAANTTGNNTYTVKVSYALNSNYGGTASQVINMIAVPNKPAISVGQ